jgi:hypothetical protein
VNNSDAVVWVTQVPNRRDRATQQLVPAVNISPAAEHGDVRVLMPPNASFFATHDLVTQLRSGLRDYNFERGDSVIALGDPAIIAVVGALLGERNRSFNVLRWDKNIGRYVKIKVAL